MAMAMVIAERATWPTDGEAEQTTEWLVVDEQLRGNKKQRGALDAHEMYWLREAVRLQIWKPLGMVSMLDYMDRVLGQKPETARKRLRVARALADLPELSEALANDELSFCNVRELCRVVTPSTERVWRVAARGKTSREIEDLVFGRRPGDLPEDPADAEATTHVLRFEVSASTFALVRETRLLLDAEHGRRLDEDELVAALCERARDGGGDGDGDSDRVGAASTGGRAKFQIALAVCPVCDRAAQTGGGVRVPVDAATLARARCDAQHIGSIDGDRPERAHQDIPPSVARFVWARDGGRCQTPGCRSARGIEIHHIIAREHGGSHDPSNLTLRCSACHTAHHAGKLSISGTAPHALETTRNVAPVGVATDLRVPPRSDATPRARAEHPSTEKIEAASAPVLQRRPRTNAELRTTPKRSEAIQALSALNWKRAIAAAAVDEALAHVTPDAGLEELIREALRRCPRPRS
jgi:hypothetical protein